jgi:plasmid stability protein
MALMPSIQIKDVPEETHAVLRRRAAAAHKSLQEYVVLAYESGLVTPGGAT